MTDYKLVPVEPTPEMEQAAESYWNERRFKWLSDDPRTWAGVYQAMLAVAPTGQRGEVPDLTSTIVNDCCWTFVKAMPHNLPAPIFNNLKPALYEALKQYHDALLTADPQPAVQGKHYDQAPDWSKAPEGATHWEPETDDTYAVWYREKDGGWECWVHPNGCSWFPVHTDYLPNLIPRPDPDWISTNGKKPELPNDTLIDVKFTNGSVDIRSRADIWIWTQNGESYDITHYRIHRPVSVPGGAL